MLYSTNCIYKCLKINLLHNTYLFAFFYPCLHSGINNLNLNKIKIETPYSGKPNSTFVF